MSPGTLVRQISFFFREGWAKGKYQRDPHDATSRQRERKALVLILYDVPFLPNATRRVDGANSSVWSLPRPAFHPFGICKPSLSTFWGKSLKGVLWDLMISMLVLLGGSVVIGYILTLMVSLDWERNLKWALRLIRCCLHVIHPCPFPLPPSRGGGGAVEQ